MSGQLTLMLMEEGSVVPAAVWETLPPQVRAKVTILLALAIEEARDD